MRIFFAAFGSFLLITFFVWSAIVLVPACGAMGRIVNSWVDWCPINKQLQFDDQIAILSATRSTLETRILERERELALLQCEIAPLPETAKVDPLPEQIDRRDWDNRRIGLLDGCWELDSRFVTTNRQTGVQSRYNVWTMCFDANGVGREEMRADNGNSCSGPVTGSFDADGDLLIEEPSDLQCSDGGYIYRLVSKCKLNDAGTASCIVSQPEVGASATVEFRRSGRGQ